MSRVSELLARGHTTLAVARGDTVGYRTGNSGQFTPLAGFVLVKQRIPNAIPDDGEEALRATAVLKGPLSPVIVRGYQIQDTPTGEVYAVESVKRDVMQVCMLERVTMTRRTPDRGGAS